MGKKINQAYEYIAAELAKERQTKDVNKMTTEQATFFWGYTRGLEMALHIVDNHRGK